MIACTKQNWQIGTKVNVGFLRGLMVVAKIPTPGDYAPDAYLLFNGSKFYQFVPHNGLTALTSDEAERLNARASERMAA